MIFKKSRALIPVGWERPLPWGPLGLLGGRCPQGGSLRAPLNEPDTQEVPPRQQDKFIGLLSRAGGGGTGEAWVSRHWLLRRQSS